MKPLVLSKYVFHFMQLVVHHLAYHAGHAPWEYEDGELLTICKECHSKLHRNKLSK